MSAISIIKVENNRIIFDHQQFSRIINHKTIGRKEICIISITGCFRKGKSFLLNYLLKYLKHKGISNKNWMNSYSKLIGNFDPNVMLFGDNTKSANNTIKQLTGFEWKGGEDATTEGIMIWSEPYVIKINDEKEVAILLMDTQGSFNVQDTLKNNADIFAISTLLSSVQIFNTSSQITEIDLQALEMFTSYSRYYESNKEGGKPFERLVYLIRDFQHKSKIDDGYGLKTGNQHWSKNSNQKSENIKSWFKSFDCYVMPHPGEEVIEDNFSGSLSKIKEKKFEKHIGSFTEWMFSAENLFTKKVMGKCLPKENLLNLFRHYDDIFKNRKFPCPTSLMEAQLKTYYEYVEKLCINNLDSAFNKFYSDDKSQGKLIDSLVEKEFLWKSSVFDEFNKEFPTENSEVKEKYKQILEFTFLKHLHEHYKMIMLTLNNDKEKLKIDKETLKKDIENLINDKIILQNDKEHFIKNIKDNTLNIEKLTKEWSAQTNRLREEIINKEAIIKEKDEEISRKAKTIEELEINLDRLKSEKNTVVKEKDKIIDQKDRNIRSINLIANQLREEQKEVIKQRIKLTQSPVIDDQAKNCNRSMTAYLENKSNCIFHLINSKVTDGVWLESPPYTLLKNDSVKWATSSNGIFCIRTSGEVTYMCKNCNTKINFTWNIPWIGKNQLTSHSDTSKHSVIASGAGDRQLVYHYTIPESAE